MSDKNNPTGQKHSSAMVAPCTRDVLQKMMESARFQDAVDDIINRHGKDDALEAVNDITIYLGQAHLLAEDVTPLTSDHFWLMQNFYELIRSMPDGDELREAQMNDMARRLK